MPVVAERLLNLEPSQAPRQEEPLAGAAAADPHWASPCQAEKRGALTSQAPPDSEAEANWHCWLFVSDCALDSVAKTSQLGCYQMQLGLVTRE